jgi:hypothetical protein
MTVLLIIHNLYVANYVQEMISVINYIFTPQRRGNAEVDYLCDACKKCRGD